MLIVVTGPPASGKSTWVRQQATSNDIVDDFDVLANALSFGQADNHEHQAPTVAAARAARKAAIGEALKYTDRADVYVLHSTPGARTLRRYRNAGARIVTIDPGEDIVRERCKRLRPAEMLPVVDRWYQAHPAPQHADQVIAASSRSREW